MSTAFSIDAIIPDMVGKTLGVHADISFTRDFLVTTYILNVLEKGGVACIVTLTKSANSLIDELSNFSPEATMTVNEAILNERLQIIDMYSFRSGIPKEIAPGTHYLTSASDLTLLSIHLNNISSQFPNLRIVISPLSLLAIYSKTSSLISFLQTLSARISSRKQSCLFLIDRGVISDDLMAKVESVIDGLVELKREETLGEMQEHFRIKFLRGLSSSEFFNWKLIT